MKKKQGFTLIETLATLAITVIILSVVFGLFFSSNYINNETSEKVSMQNEYASFYNSLNNMFSQDNTLSSLNNPKNGYIDSKTNNKIFLYFCSINDNGKKIYVGSEKNGEYITLYKFIDPNIQYSSDGKEGFLNYSSKIKISSDLVNINCNYLLNDKIISLNGILADGSISQNFNFIFQMDNKNANYYVVENSK